MKIKQKTLTFLSAAALISCLTNNAYVKTHKNSDDKSFYAGVDYLFWKAQEDQTYYAVKSTGNFDLGFLSPTEYNVVNQCFKGTSGVRLQAGYAWCNCWDTFLTYTYFNACSTSSIQAPQNIMALSLFSLIGNNTLASSAHNTWHAKLNRVDWEVGFTHEFCESIIVRPTAGITWAQIKQQQSIAYDGIPDISAALTEKQNRFSGTGPRIGIDAQWFFYRNFSIAGVLSGALLAGKSNAHTDVTITAEPPLLPTTQTFRPKVVDCKKIVAPTTQLVVGLNWETSYSCTTVDIGIAYEAQYWWNQWQAAPSIIGPIATTAGHGDFTTHGLTASLGLRF